jgi:hypothetical protein
MCASILLASGRFSYLSPLEIRDFPRRKDSTRHSCLLRAREFLGHCQPESDACRLALSQVNCVDSCVPRPELLPDNRQRLGFHDRQRVPFTIDRFRPRGINAQIHVEWPLGRGELVGFLIFAWTFVLEIKVKFTEWTRDDQRHDGPFMHRTHWRPSVQEYRLRLATPMEIPERNSWKIAENRTLEAGSSPPSGRSHPISDCC